jgi:hypothetical protein
LQVLFGKTIEKSGDLERSTNKVIIHPSFNPALGINDIALLRLSKTVPFSGKTLTWLRSPNVALTLARSLSLIL